MACTLSVLRPDRVCVSAVLVCCALVPCSSTHTLVAAPQSRPGMPGLDAFQLVDIMMRLTRKEMAIPTQGDDLADFQQFVASGAWGDGGRQIDRDCLSVSLQSSQLLTRLQAEVALVAHETHLQPLPACVS